MLRVGRGIRSVTMLATLALLLAGPCALGSTEETPGDGSVAPKSSGMGDTGIIAISVAAVVGASCIAAGYAVARVGSAALGAASERPELLGRSLILVGLAEGIAIYGLIIGIMLLRLVK